MNFDQRWLQFEIKHGPQPPGAKEDALFWYNAGQNDTEDATTKEEDSRSERDWHAAGHAEGFRGGLVFVIRRVKEFAEADAPEDHITKETLLQFLETLR